MAMRIEAPGSLGNGVALSPRASARTSGFASRGSQRVGRRQRKRSRPEGRLPFSGTLPPERKAIALPAGARPVGDLDTPVLRLADAVGGLDQRTAFAERLSGHDAVG